MRKHGSAAELETRRRLAGQLLLEGREIGEVVEIVGASISSVKRWKRTVKEGGLDALKAKPHPGPKPRLDAKQKQQLLKILLAGPRQAGYKTDLWTCGRVAAIIAKTFRVSYHQCHVWKILHSMNWTCQKPEQRARECDEAAQQRWRERDWPRIKRGRARR
ncbi:MAG: winged helix-turn-helix domain-containing protein [Thermoguttaceae bacterium]